VSLAATSRGFAAAARDALADPALQRALANIPAGFQVKRRNALAEFPEWRDLSDAALAIKNHTLANLDFYLEAFEARVKESGGQMHWCRDDEEAREAVLRICERAGVKRAIKSKTMVAEEIALNPYLESRGIECVENDMGEYVLQLRREAPSHIIAPIIHLNRGQIADSFRELHKGRDAARHLESARELLNEARAVLREKFLAAEAGITGANFLIAETGSAAIVTNEGNADLTVTLPRVHIVVASIEKLVPTIPETWVLLRLLARFATGQDITAYTTFVGGPKRSGETEGPAEFHVVLLDNGRARMLGGEFHDMLRCIRCGACINHCPVYGAVGGHAYGSVYPGPMGAVLTPALAGLTNAAPLPEASSLCGRCEEVCPLQIPIPRMLRAWRTREFSQGLGSLRARIALRLWAYFAKRPALYHAAANIAARFLRIAARLRLPLPILSAWTKTRTLPAAPGETFQSLYKKRGKP